MLHILTEDGNRELKHRFFPLGDNIRKHLQATLDNYDGDKTIDGYKRLNNLLSMENGIAYNEMKRLKNYFDTYMGSPKSIEYILNGGEPMRLWVNATLNRATKGVEDYKDAKQAAGIPNSHIGPHEKDRETKPSDPTIPIIQNAAKDIDSNSSIKYESKKRVIVITEEQARILKENEAYRTYGIGNYSLEKFKPIKNRLWYNKPSGGLWASPTHDNVNVWKSWAENEFIAEYDDDDYFEFKLSDNARVLTLNSIKDCEKIPMQWDNPAYQNDRMWRHILDKQEVFEISNHTSDWLPDFEKLSEMYDAIYFTSANGLYQALLGWDCDSLLIMNPNVIQIIKENPNSEPKKREFPY